MSKSLIYLLDDDVELNRIIERRFVLFGCDVKCFSDADLLFKAFHEQRPALVLIDLNLGEGLSGFDVIKKIRNDYKASLPIIILSGDRDQKQIAHGLEIGANDFIPKPPLRQNFEEIISQYITADNLSEPTVGTFQPVTARKQASRMSFRVSIEEIRPAGITLLSDHLIKKGASFYLSGAELKKITPGSDKLFVRVIESAMKIISEQKKYQIHLEIDVSEVRALKEIREFLEAKSEVTSRPPTSV